MRVLGQKERIRLVRGPRRRLNVFDEYAAAVFVGTNRDSDFAHYEYVVADLRTRKIVLR